MQGSQDKTLSGVNNYLFVESLSIGYLSHAGDILIYNAVGKLFEFYKKKTGVSARQHEWKFSAHMSSTAAQNSSLKPWREEDVEMGGRGILNFRHKNNQKQLNLLHWLFHVSG